MWTIADCMRRLLPHVGPRLLSVVKRLLSFEVPSSTEWQPPGSPRPFSQTGLLTFQHNGAKARGSVGLLSEMRDWPHARSIAAVEHLARWRGAQVGVEAAEAFCLLRQLV